MILFVERIIEEAIARGDFDDLPGEGKPLPTGDDGPGWWIRSYVERMRREEQRLLPGEGAVVGDDVNPREAGGNH
ncbi:MAG TPA: DUF1992 domain-containing protein [Acidimicrobiia bacterium]|nr:DUF1992 domain-containing protein [Acidimicrobiia bacterium]